MTNLALWLERAGKGDPQRPALGLGTRVLRSYGEVAERVARLAGALRAMGLTPGDRVAIAATNSPDYLEILYAIWHAGLAAVPANAKLHGAELGYILDHSEARVCFASEQLRADIAAHAPKSLERLIAIGSAEYERLFQSDAIGAASVGPSDLAWLFYTSGTTGRPKGVMLSHGNLVAMSLCYLADVDAVTPEDAALYAAPISHGAGLYNMIHVRFGARHVVPQSGGFDPGEVLDNLLRTACHLVDDPHGEEFLPGVAEKLTIGIIHVEEAALLVDHEEALGRVDGPVAVDVHWTEAQRGPGPGAAPAFRLKPPLGKEVCPCSS